MNLKNFDFFIVDLNQIILFMNFNGAFDANINDFSYTTLLITSKNLMKEKMIMYFS